jgi:nitroreductase
MQKNKAGERFWVQDCSAASENILLAAQALGLGGVWIGIHPVHLFEAQVRSILNLPNGVTPLNLLYLGIRPKKRKPHTYKKKRVHWGAFPGGNEIVPEDDNEKDIVEGDHDLSDF